MNILSSIPTAKNGHYHNDDYNVGVNSINLKQERETRERSRSDDGIPLLLFSGIVDETAMIAPSTTATSTTSSSDGHLKNIKIINNNKKGAAAVIGPPSASAVVESSSLSSATGERGVGSARLKNLMECFEQENDSDPNLRSSKFALPIKLTKEFNPRSTSVPENDLRNLSINKLQFQSLGLVGREGQIKVLENALHEHRNDSVVNDDIGGTASNSCPVAGADAAAGGELRIKSRHMVWISGYSGVGKSALGLELKKKATRDGRTLFVSGKFDQQRVAEPYLGFREAFSSLCDDLNKLGQRDQVLYDLQDELDDQLPVLLSIMPGLEKLLKQTNTTLQQRPSRLGTESQEFTLPDADDSKGETNNDDRDGEIGLLESRNRFYYVVRKFIQVVARVRPLVIILDDLQWGDLPSLKLVEKLMTDKENVSGLLLIGIYRSNEITPILKTEMESIEKRATEDPNLKTTTLAVNNLSVQSINILLAELLSTTLDRAEKLACIIHRKTQGNIFFVIQFLRSLNEKGWLVYNLGALKWTWSEEKIEAETNATDNVYILMRKKLERSEVSRSLQLMSCLGSSVEKTTLSRLAKKLQKQQIDDKESMEILAPLCQRSWIDISVDEGLVELVGESQVRFIHDKFQEAAFSLIPTDERGQLQFRIGMVLLENLTEEELDSMFFVVTNLLNHGIDCARSSEVRSLLARMNLKAGRKAIKAAAFLPAAAYLSVGIDLLPPDHWDESFELSADLYATAAEAEFCLGNFVRMRFLCKQVLTQNRMSQDCRFRIQIVLILALSAEFRNKEAIKMCREVLGELGCNLPCRGIPLAIILGLMKTKKLLNKYTPDELLDLPKMQDESKLASMVVLDRFVTFCYQEEEPVMLLAILKMVEYTLIHGLCDLSAPAFAMYAMVLAGVLNDPKGGKVYAEVAEHILKKLQARRVEARTVMIVNVFVQHWVQSVQSTLKPLLGAYKAGLAVGDMENTVICIHYFCTHALYSGRSLASVEADLQTYCKQMLDLGNTKFWAYTVLFLHYVANLRGKADKKNFLTGHSHYEHELMSHKHVKAVSNFLQLFFSYQFGDFEKGMRLLKSLSKKSLLEAFPGQILLLPTALMAALTCLAMARRTKTKAKKYRRISTQYTSWIQTWVSNGSQQAQHYLPLIHGEIASLEKRYTDARKNYLEAMVIAGRKGLIQDRALAIELLGEHYLRDMKDTEEAGHYLKESSKLYQEWGASEKCEQLHFKFPAVFQDE